jgi:hypothetical protein
MLLTVLAAACVETTTVPRAVDVIVLHAVLNPASAEQQVVLQRTSYGYTGGSAVPGATITLRRPDGTTVVAPQPPKDTSDFFPQPTVYRLAAGPLMAGQQYTLHAVLATGETVDGTTTIPRASPTTVVSTATLNLQTDTLRLSWPRVPGAPAYEVRVRSSRGTFIVYTDTSVVLPGTGTIGRPIFFAGEEHDVVVSAVDDNYYQYYRLDSDPFTGTALPTSLLGAQGVFGSLVPILRMTVTAR